MSISKHFSRKLLTFQKRTFLIQRCASVGSYCHNPGAQPLQYMTIGQLANNSVNSYGDSVAIVSEHQQTSMTFSEAVRQADLLASGLLELGLQPGDRLGLCSSNTVQWYVTSIAAAKIGLILVAINPAYVKNELEYCLRKVGAKALIMEETFKTQNFYKMMCEMAPEIKTASPGSTVKSKSMPFLTIVIITSSSKLPGTFRFDDILKSSGNFKPLHEIESKIQPEQASSIVFTSGTTGHPKGVIQSHFNLVNNSYTIGKRLEFQNNRHKILVQNPFFHVFGLVIAICNSLSFGNTLILPSASFKAESSIAALIKHKCTVLYGTPTMYVDLCDKAKQIDSTEIKSPQIAVCGGSLCSPHLFSRMIECFECDRVFSVYGQTECTAVSFQSTAKDSTFLMTSTVGTVGEHLEVKIVNKNGEVVPKGVAGELYVRGYSLMKGYWDEEEKTKEVITPDGWLKTGDLFILLENNYGQVIGRLKDIIIRGGENISPKEIEEFLLTHPDIYQAEVYGVKDDRMGEEVGCSLIMKNNKTLTPEQVQYFCKGKIAHYKIPKYIEFLDEYPKTVSGKIQKYKLKQNMENKF